MQNYHTLREIQSAGVIDLISTLRTVEINPIDVCNRSCNFCPRSESNYSNGSFINLSLIEKIATDLSKISFNGRISFAGFGEPLLYKQLSIAINTIKNIVKTVTYIEIITNADYLTTKKIKDLESAGCTHITVSMYDCDISSKIAPLFYNSSIVLTFKHCYNSFDYINRPDIYSQKKALYIVRSCYIPFYKLFIDYNGQVLLCANDWGRTAVVGDIHVESIKEIWLGDKITEYRNMLVKQSRTCSPCKFCDVNGTLMGKESFDMLSCSIT